MKTRVMAAMLILCASHSASAQSGPEPQPRPPSFPFTLAEEILVAAVCREGVRPLHRSVLQFQGDTWVLLRRNIVCVPQRGEFTILIACDFQEESCTVFQTQEPARDLERRIRSQMPDPAAFPDR